MPRQRKSKPTLELKGWGGVFYSRIDRAELDVAGATTGDDVRARILAHLQSTSSSVSPRPCMALIQLDCGWRSLNGC
jgi:hypothetical protein